MAQLPRIGVLASGEGTNLQTLLDTLHGREVDVVGVASDKPQARALERAAAAGVQTAVFERGAFADRASRDLAIAQWLEDQGVQVVVLAGYMAILDVAFIDRFRDRIVNVHPSLLPAFPGVRAIEQAVDHGVHVFGVTVHLVDEGVDTGPILLQRAVELPGETDPARVHAALRPLEHELLPRAVRALAAGTVRRDPANPRRTVLGD
ncbi:phosphoribosylglycinamide formyltransferase [Conexibacter sp. SYSU D00693]|uniref:phosphoribosylglycinamide formyltransferase n=1 Tax=Conexibacter sp. SYSU D00693 TaxID=2812560 RepID=UPI00196AAEDA|nr:phosphoribosylglycinamide formyltransferase [Conexibacter sp. SYSU D00693]